MHRIQVAVRVNPTLPSSESESPDDATAAASAAAASSFPGERKVEIASEKSCVTLRRDCSTAEEYNFDAVFPGHAAQKAIYQQIAAPVVQAVLDGYNGMLLAYGQTGSGKTYTISSVYQGQLPTEANTDRSVSEKEIVTDDVAQRGMVSRSMEDILAKITGDSQHDYRVTVTYVQIYNEVVYDLLSSDGLASVQIAQDSRTSETTLQGGCEVQIRTMEDFVSTFIRANSHRKTASHRLNTLSSRSHTILTVTLLKKQRFIASSGQGPQSVLMHRAKLSFVDLAGSERIDRSSSKGELLEEARCINRSLAALGKCIIALAAEASTKKTNPQHEDEPSAKNHVPYRDSKLTTLLKDSLVGNCRAALIVTIFSCATHLEETRNSLKFGQRALKVNKSVAAQQKADYQLLSKQQEIQIYEQIEAIERLEVWVAQLQSRFECAREELETSHRQNRELEAIMEAEVRVATQRLEQETNDKLQMQNAVLQEEYAVVIDALNAKLANLMAQNANLLREHDQKMKDAQEAFEKTIESKSREITELQNKFGLRLYKQEALSHFETSSGDSLIATQKMTLNNEEAKEWERQVKLERQRHEKTRRRLCILQQLVEDGGPFNKTSVDGAESSGGESASVSSSNHSSRRFWSLGGGGSAFNKRNFQLNIAEEIAERRDDHSEALEQSTDEYRKIINSLSVEIESMKEQMRQTTKIFERLGCSTLLNLLSSTDDIDVRRTAAKAIANMGARDSHQDEIVRMGGIDAIFAALKGTQDTTLQKLLLGSLANLAINESSQIKLMENSSLLRLLMDVAHANSHYQIQRMVAATIANLCGNSEIKDNLVERGAIEGLVSLGSEWKGRKPHPDVVLQIARGLANFTIGHHNPIAIVNNGGLSILSSMASSSNISVKKNAALTLFHLSQLDSIKPALHKDHGCINALLGFTKCERKDLRALAAKAIRSLKIDSIHS